VKIDRVPWCKPSGKRLQTDGIENDLGISSIGSLEIIRETEAANPETRIQGYGYFTEVDGKPS